MDAINLDHAPDDATTAGNDIPESVFPPANERPCFIVLDDWADKTKPGVWYCRAETLKDGSVELRESWLCSPLHIDAETFDGQENNHGRLLRFKSTTGKWRKWAMPMELLRGDGSDLRGELLSMGMQLDPYRARQDLPVYLQWETPKRKITCALQVGWCDGSFVLPDEVIGPKASGVIFQSGERGHDEHTQAGTLDGWKTGIAALAVGNPLLMLALSAGFAGPVLARCNAESGGVHFVGDSSTGKTTAIDAACSIWGGTNYKRSWRATSNGMEGAAALFNDCLLALDEISECDPREVGAIVYSLGNGRGKQRAGRSGNARGVTRWRCAVLSSGERTISTTMQEAGQRVKAGQSIRLLDIPAARTYGAWDNLHGFTSGQALSDSIKLTATKHHGKAGRAFLEQLTRDNDDFCSELETMRGLREFSEGIEAGQDKRAAGRFALLAYAGELATSYGITGWPEGAAIEAAAVCFKAWREMRGGGNDEARQIVERVTGFIEAHGDSRFSGVDADGEIKVINRAGWWRDGSNGREYLFTSAGMREATKGFDFNRALELLQQSGLLDAAGADGKRSAVYRAGENKFRAYKVTPERLHHGN